MFGRTLTAPKSRNTDNADAGPREHFASDAFFVAGRAAALEVGTVRARDLRNLQCVPRAVDAELRHVLAGLRCRDPQTLVQNLRAGAPEALPLRGVGIPPSCSGQTGTSS